MLSMEIGGVRFKMDPAAVSALRYRVVYGNSIVNDLASCTSVDDLEGRLLCMCYEMIPIADRPELLEFARLARKDPDFLQKAHVAKSALLAPDPALYVPSGEESGEEPFDEYKILALMVVAGIDMELIYQLPILHLVSLANHVAQLRDPESKTYRPMTGQELGQLYPRRQ